MQRVNFIFMIIILLTFLLAGCLQTSELQAVSVKKLSDKTHSSNSVNTTRNPIVEDNYVTLASTSLISTSVQISNYWGLAIDEQFAYWVDESNITAIQRRSLTTSSNKTEIIAQGTFSSGIVSDPVISSNNRWLLFLDRESSYVGGNWKVQAVDLLNQSTKVILEASGVPYETQSIVSLGFLWYGLGSNEVALSYALQPDANDCQRVVLRILNLDNERNQVIQETNCAKSNEIWIWPQVKQDKLVVERSIPADFGGTDILLHDLHTKEEVLLTTDGNNAAPQISDEYVIWKRAYRSEYGRAVGVYDLRTQEVKTIVFPTPFPRVMINQHWIYWLPDSYQSLYVYDLHQDSFILVADSANCKWFFDSVVMRNNIIAWIRRDIDQNAYFLEWRSINGLPKSEYTICQRPPL